MSLVLETLKEKMEIIEKERGDVYQERIAGIRKVMEHYFGNYVSTIKTNPSNTTFYNDVEGSETQNAIMVCQLYHDLEYIKARGTEPEIYLSHYSSNVQSDDELSAMVSKGEIAKQVLLNRADIIERVVQVFNNHSDSIKEVNKKYYEIYDAIREEEKRIVEDEKSQLKRKLQQGFRMKWVIENANVYRRLPMLQTGYQADISLVGIKEVGRTASGKTVTLEVIRPNREYNTKTEKWFDTEHKSSLKVRSSYIDSFLNEVYYDTSSNRKENYRVELVQL